MPLFTSSSPFDADIEKATDELRTTEDWGLIMDICDKIKASPTGPKDCLRSIVKRINHKVPLVAMQALTLLDACVANCGRPLHLEMASRDFISECRTLLSGGKANPKVLKKLRLLIQKWALNEFKSDSALDLIPSLYNSLKQEGADFTPDEPQKTARPYSNDPNVVNSEEEQADIAKAIALSLQESQKGGSKNSSSSLYPSVNAGSNAVYATVQRVKEQRKVRALYDFEAAEENELTFKAGELVNIIDDSDPNWWKGSNQRGEGLFPANFVTADLTAEPEEKVKERKSVQFNEEVQVKTVEVVEEEVTIDEAKIDRALNLIQNADPTGEINPDGPELLKLEEQCRVMHPLIDQAFERFDRRQNRMIELNKRLSDAMQMYHALMKEAPMYGGYSTKYGPPPHQQQQYGMIPPQDTMYNSQSTYGMPQQAFMSAPIGYGAPYGGPMTANQRGPVPPMSVAPMYQYSQQQQPAYNNPGGPGMVVRQLQAGVGQGQGQGPQSLPPMMNSGNQTMAGVPPSGPQPLPPQLQYQAQNRVTSPQPDLTAFQSMPMSSYNTVPSIAAQNTPYQQQQQSGATGLPLNNSYTSLDQQQQLVYQSPKHAANASQLL